MGILSNRVEKSEIKAGDHIYTWRAVYTYSHHGVYVGGEKVVHFTRKKEASSSSSSSSSPSSGSRKLDSSSSSGLNIMNNNYDSGDILGSAASCPVFPDCGFQHQQSGVTLSCLDCFLGNGGSLYCFKYGVTPSVFLAKFRGGTCTLAESDPADVVIHRAMYLLRNGFGNYNLFENNCEDFALYCKTGLLPMEDQGVGRSGQASSFIGMPLAAICSTPFRLLAAGPVGMATMTAGMYCAGRYITDIGVRKDVVKVAVEDLAVNLGWSQSHPDSDPRPDQETTTTTEKEEEEKEDSNQLKRPRLLE